MRAMTARMEERERVSVAHISDARLLLATRDSQRGWVSQVMCACGKVRRSAATAGKVWTMSPSDPRRTMRNRGSGIAILAHAREQCAGGMIFRVSDDGYADAETG